MKRNNFLMSAVAAASAVQAGSLEDVKHIVLFMQENRAFDHYFGTMAGVRGFGDPNVQVNDDGLSTFEQPLESPQNGSNILTPWHINYLGGDWNSATECMGAGDNGWSTMHTAYNKGKGNRWTAADGGYSMGYFTRDDIPTHFDIAEGWTVLDMNTQSVLAATDPNRIMWMSGSINIPGSPTNPDGEGGIIIDNNATPGCEAPKLNCFPFVWKTFPEYLEDAGVSWQVWQDFDNFEDNMLAYFKQYQQAENGSALRTKGNSYPGLDAFFESAAQGTLPQISYIVGPQELAEHPPNRPTDGAWLQKQVVDAITSSPAYDETVLIISYDEQGGWADHVVPVVPDKGTPGEWMTDPYNNEDTPVGPGWRQARYIVSPWTRGGNVLTEPADHTSDMMFIEEWAEANGYDIYNDNITPWRRKHMSNLVNAFDFNNHDSSTPHIHQPPTPEIDPESDDHWSGNLSLGSLTGPWIGPARCLSDYPSSRPPIPYGVENANQEMSLLVEEGYKAVRGKLTEGRYLTFETLGQALSNVQGLFAGVSLATDRHERLDQRWILHSVGGPNYGNEFYIQSALDGQYIARLPRIGGLTKDRDYFQAFSITYNADTVSYTISPIQVRNKYVSFMPQLAKNVRRDKQIEWTGNGFGEFKIYAVSYH